MMNMKSAHSHTCKAGNNDDVTIVAKVEVVQKTEASSLFMPALDLTALIGQQERLQSFGCPCDTHLLRSVFKLLSLVV